MQFFPPIFQLQLSPGAPFAAMQTLRLESVAPRLIIGAEIVDAILEPMQENSVAGDFIKYE